jgi:hypothetical protein
MLGEVISKIDIHTWTLLDSDVLHRHLIALAISTVLNEILLLVALLRSAEMQTSFSSLE